MKILAIMIAAVMFIGGQAVAGDCEEESNAGYGLCTAYCEAMNCDDPGAREASQQACDKVRANYISLSGKAELPCVEPSLQDEIPSWQVAYE